ncbi:MAG: replication-associated recombination protein A [Actinomycetota bacterium]
MPAQRRRPSKPAPQQEPLAPLPPGAPLAARMRPRTLDEFVGQTHILETNSVLRSAIEEDRLRSVLLFGPAGTGKTSLAHLIAHATSAAFVQLSAVTAGVADVRRFVEEGRERLAATGRRTILFVDEVHRFSKTQQDGLLPGVESGAIVFIGATTENPFFSIVSPLLSRSLLFRLEKLTGDELAEIIARALADDERGLGHRGLTIDDAAAAFLAAKAEGDARIALNGLEAAADRAQADGRKTITVEDASDVVRQRLVRYDRAGDQHYDAISAFIKSMRGSDPDASLAWLARMIKAGEDPRFIARRMLIFASEDIGEADPQSLVIATAAAQAVQIVGMPEAQLNLAHAAVHLANAPKSNAVIRSIEAALADVEQIGQGGVPVHLRDAHYPGASTLGHGAGYKYPPAHGGDVEQEYMPEGLEGRRYWRPDGEESS